MDEALTYGLQLRVNLILALQSRVTAAINALAVSLSLHLSLCVFILCSTGSVRAICSLLSS